MLLLVCWSIVLNAQVSGSSYQRQAYFGDLHLHTAYSFDAIASGTGTTPEDAYRYARGEVVEYMGREIQRKQALDFLAVTDHAEYLGVPYEAGDLEGLLAGTKWPAEIGAAGDDTLAYMRIFSPSAFAGTSPPIEALRTAQIITSLWQREVDAAERFYEPGKFTTLVGFEWSPMPGGAHLHRNVIFRGPDYPDRPFSSLDSQRPEALWTYVEDLREQGIDSVLIPHNSNLSRGRMFAITDSSAQPMSGDYAQRRMTNERLVEITQNKGTSETRPGYSPDDEFAGFELLSLSTEAGSDPAGGYVRQALGRGLVLGSRLGVNPFQFGLIGSSDFHSGAASTEEDNFSGALGQSDDMQNPEAVLTEINPISATPATVFSSAGLTGVWAESNTRESIFNALKRREAFATSGTRIRIRMFAGWNFTDDHFEQDDWVELAYRGGVPMGGELVNGSGVQARLRFVIQAVGAPQGANLDRVQIIKVWYAGGEVHEKVFDVAWSGKRQADPVSGKLPAVGNTVDLETATYVNTIGARQLAIVWTDPGFDPVVASVYYARVLEIPTPRWSTYLAIRNGLPVPDSVPATIQERAWTSPVYYHPGSM